MSADRFTIFKGETSPSLRQVITLDGEAVVFTPGDAVELHGFLSGHDPSPLKIDAAGIIDVMADGVARYDFAAGDTDTAGLLIAWWVCTISGETFSTPQFVVPILDQTGDPGVGIYASVLDVKAAGGFLANAWKETGTDVSEMDLATFLALASSDVDVILSSAGVTLPLTNLIAVGGLRGLITDGALVRAINATWPNDPPGAALVARNMAYERWLAGIAALKDGSHSVLDLLVNDASNINEVASSLWTDEPEYGLVGWYAGVFYGAVDPDDLNPNLAPQSRRGDVL